MTIADFDAAATQPRTEEDAARETERLKREFYLAVLTKAEQIFLPVADQIGGLDREISVLRVKLRQVMKRLNSGKGKEDDQTHAPRS